MYFRRSHKTGESAWLFYKTRQWHAELASSESFYLQGHYGSFSENQLEQKSSARVIDFDADAFDVATDNWASKTSTSFLSDLYEEVTIKKAVLNGTGKSKVTRIGKEKYIYVDNDKGCDALSTTTTSWFVPGYQLTSFLFQSGQNY
jgi:hypothetical protein